MRSVYDNHSNGTWAIGSSGHGHLGVAMQSRAVVLLSGGLDSATTLAIARAQGFCRLRFGPWTTAQRHRRELEAARHIAEALGVSEHRIVRMDLRAIGGSALTGEQEVPKDRRIEDIESGIPVTYVPSP
jgi:7-cyano-7-deazaguanine synthase